MQLDVSPPVLEHGNAATSAASNPFLGGCRLHANHYGAPAITVNWIISEFPWEGLVFINGNFERGNMAWKGTARLDVAAKQAGRVYRSESLIEDDERARWGIGFINDGSPLTLQFTVSVLTLEAHLNGLFSVSPALLERPVFESTPELFDLSGVAHESGKTLTSANQGGLMNRLVPMLSTVLVAERDGRRPQVLWGPNEHCAARFPQIFDLEANEITQGDIGALASDHCTHSAYEPKSPALVLERPETNILVHSTSPLVTDPDLGYGYADLGPVFNRLRLSEPIRRMLAAFDGTDFSRTVALHIRRPYPNGAFSELETSKFRLGMDVFRDLVRDLCQAAPWMERVLVCTNGPEAEAEMREVFGDLVLTFAKTTVDNTREPRAVQEALVDLTLMSRCPLLFSQETTSFGHFAHVIGGGTMVAVTNGTTEDAYQFWIFREGRHVDVVSCGRGDTAKLAALVDDWTHPSTASSTR